jgi:two-component sensor histidine kinase
VLPAIIGFVFTIALLFAIRLILLSRTALNISGAILLLTMACSLMGYLYQLVAQDLPSVLFWQKVQVLGINFMYPAWLIFVLLLTGNRKYICWRLLVVLFVLSIFPNIVLNTPSITSWFVTTNGLIPAGPYNVLDQDNGWVVWFATTVATIQGFVGSLTLLSQRKRLRSSYKPQFYLLLLLPIFAFLAIWLEITGNNFVAPLSLFNLSIIPLCVIISFTIYSLRVGEETKLLKENVVESLHSSVLILDAGDRIQYANPAACTLLGKQFGERKNLPLAMASPVLSEYLSGISSQNDEPRLITLSDFVFDIKVKNTLDWRGETVTRMIVLTNITEIDHLEKTIIDQNREISHSNTLLSGLAKVNLFFQSSNNLEDMFAVLDEVLRKIGLSFLITTIDPVSNDLVIKYLTPAGNAIQHLEGILGSKVQGYHIPEKYFPQLKDFLAGIIPEQNFSSQKILKSKLHPVVKQSFHLIGIDLNLPIFLYQLKTGNKPLGILCVWGKALDKNDYPTLRIFANQMASAIERNQAYQKEVNRSIELTKSNQLITALVNVTTLMSSSGDYTQSLHTLGSEIEQLNLHCVLGLLNEPAEAIIFKYASFTPNILRYITNLTKLNFIGYEIPRKLWPGTKVINEGIPVWYSNPAGIFQKLFPLIPNSTFKKIMKSLGIADDQKLCILPLIAKGKVIGVFPVWGEGITEEDTSTLTVFAYQVGEILERTKEYAEEQNRANKLARSNAILIALSRVASRLETTTESTEIYNTLGGELKNVGFECMVGSLDEKIDSMTMEYLSISQSILDFASAYNVKWPEKIHIPRSLWPTDSAVINKEPYWDETPIHNVSKMFPYIPKKLIAQSFKSMGMPEGFHMCYLPIIVNDAVVGVLSVWGSDLQAEDVPSLMVFANQVGQILDRTRQYDIEQNRANKLARSNAILIALSKVASRLETTTDLTEIYNTLGSELKRMHIECLVGTLDEKKEILNVEYLSVSKAIYAKADTFNLKWPGRLRVPRSLWPSEKALTEKEPFWDPDPTINVSKMFPYVPKKLMVQIFKNMGMPEVFHMCYLPIIANDDVVGMLAVWGPDLQEEDVPGLIVFANQVSTSINNVKLYDQAQKEIIIRTEAEKKIQESLSEKEVLLKEVHHRVKNNLQIISSLLNLQMSQSTDQALTEGLRESQSRVRAMALIHEKLYQSEDLARIDMSSYISSLTNTLVTTYRVAEGKVDVQIDTSNIFLDLESAIPCGLIVNELISNSLKYAFPGDRTGVINVSFKEPHTGYFTLNVKDNGVGLPKGLNPEKGSSLGLKLVSSLVRQIEGEIKFTNEVGANYEINFSNLRSEQ